MRLFVWKIIIIGNLKKFDFYKPEVDLYGSGFMFIFSWIPFRNNDTAHVFLGRLW